MNQQESDLINGLFDRLRQVETQPRDPQAETLIKDRLAKQPAAAYALTQAVIVQEQVMTGLQQQVEDLQRQVQQLQQQPAPQQSGGFLSGLFGGGSVPQTTRPMAPPQPAPQPGGPWGGSQPQAGPAPGPWGAAQQQAAAPRGGSGFLATAAATAVGIGGGILAANAISSMFSGGGNKNQSLFEDKTASASEPASQEPASAFSNLGPNDSQGYSSDLASGYDDSFDSGFDSSDA